MYSSTTYVRVSYADTDQMGIVYYGNYARFYEIGRTEALRSSGLTYNEMEKRGIIMPVLNMHCEYLSPAYYDDLLSITTIVRTLPKARMEFLYEIRNEAGKLINKGKTELVFLNTSLNRPVRAPEYLIDFLKECGDFS